MSFGGAVKLKGESEYRRALQQITQSLKEVTAQMKVTTASYSNNDNSMGALSAKSTDLTNKLGLQEGKLAALRKQYESMGKQYADNTNKHNALIQKYEDEKAKLEYIGKTLGTTSKEYKDQKQVVENLANEVKKSTVNQNANAKAMSNMGIEIKKAEADVIGTKNAITGLDSAMAKSSAEAKAMSSAYGKLKTTISDQESRLRALKAEYANVVLEQGKNSKAAKELGREITELDSELAKNKTKLNEADKAADEFSKSISDAGKSAEKSSGGFSVLAGAMANLVANGISRLASAITGQFQTAISRVDTINSYTRTMENLGYKSKEVTKATDRLKKGIEGLPTTLPNIMSMQQQYAALSGNIDEATELTLALNNATLAGGQGQEVANGALQQWYQIIAAGKPDLDAWRIISGAMPAQMNQIAESVMGAGKKSQDLFKAWQKGKVTTEQIKKALIKLNKEGGGGLTSFEKQVGGATSGINTSMANMRTAIANGVSKVIEAVGSNNISAAFDKMKKIIGNTFTDIANGMKWIIDNRAAVTMALTAIAAGVGAYVTYSTALKVIENGWKSIEIVQKAVAAAQALINATNPVGLLVAGVTAVVAAYGYYKSKTDETIVAQRQLDNRIKDTSKTIEENRKSWDSLVESQQKAINTSMTEMSNYGALYDELQSIVDQNGKIKKGYEDRASFITSTLSEALGVEIKTVNGVVQKYGDLKKTIDEVMQKKKAQIILDAQESLYSEAITKQQEALKSLAKTETDLADVRQKRKDLDVEYQKANEEFIAAIGTGDETLIEMAARAVGEYDKKIQKLDEETASLEENHAAQLDDVQKYAYNISQYENNMALAHAGKYDEMTNTNWEYVKEYQAAGDAQKAALQDQVTNEENNLRILKEMKDKSGSDIYDSQIKASEKRLQEAKDSLKKYTSATDTGLNETEKTWRDSLGQQLSDISGKKIEFKKLGDGTVQMYTNGVKQGAPMAEAEAKKLAEDMVKEADAAKKGAKTAGEDFVEGVGSGVSNQNKQSGVFSKISTFASNILTKLRNSLQEQSPSKATKQMGEYLLEGLSLGIKSGESEVLNQVSGVGRSVVSALQDELNQNVQLGNITSSVSRSRFENANNPVDMVDAFKTALSQMTVEMDDETMGKFVEKTVARAIYT